jgi:hypothetical protein
MLCQWKRWGHGEITPSDYNPSFEIFNRSVNNCEVNTKCMFDGQVLVILVSQDLWGQNTSTGLPRSKIFFGKAGQEIRACFAALLWALVCSGLSSPGLPILSGLEEGLELGASRRKLEGRPRRNRKKNNPTTLRACLMQGAYIYRRLR